MEAANVTGSYCTSSSHDKNPKKSHRSGHWSSVPCPDSLFFMLQGQKVLFSNNIITPSLLKRWLPWQRKDIHRILSVFACNFPPSDFFLTYRTRYKEPTRLPVSRSPIVLSSDLLLSYFIHRKWKWLRFPLSGVYNVKHPPGISLQ